MIHQLRTLPEYFEAVISGNRTFEVRKNDRDFKVGDFLALNELTENPVNEDGDRKETGRCCLVEVMYILDNPTFCQTGQIIMGIKPCAIRRHDGFNSDEVPVYGQKLFKGA